MISCDACGCTRESEGLAWSFEAGEPPRWLCPSCARRHLRDIEAKLSPEWWIPDT